MRTCRRALKTSSSFLPEGVACSLGCLHPAAGTPGPWSQCRWQMRISLEISEHGRRALKSPPPGALLCSKQMPGCSRLTLQTVILLHAQINVLYSLGGDYTDPLSAVWGCWTSGTDQGWESRYATSPLQPCKFPVSVIQANSLCLSLCLSGSCSTTYFLSPRHSAGAFC